MAGSYPKPCFPKPQAELRDEIIRGLLGHSCKRLCRELVEPILSPIHYNYVLRELAGPNFERNPPKPVVSPRPLGAPASQRGPECEPGVPRHRSASGASFRA